MTTQLRNINLFVVDVAASAAFFAEGLGWTCDEQRSVPPGFALLQAGELTLTLQSPATPGAVVNQADSVELGFETDDVAGLRDRLAALGATVESVQTMGWGTACDVRDPNGIRLTLFRRRD